MKNLINTISWPVVCVVVALVGLIATLLTAAFGGPECIVNTGLWTFVTGGVGAMLPIVYEKN